jgi:hypothetical protein
MGSVGANPPRQKKQKNYELEKMKRKMKDTFFFSFQAYSNLGLFKEKIFPQFNLKKNNVGHLSCYFKYQRSFAIKPKDIAVSRKL